MEKPKKPTKRKYPHYQVKEIDHQHPRAIRETTEIQTEDGTLLIRRSMQSETKSTIIPHSKNPNIITICDYPIRIIRYKNSKKAFVYDLDGIFLGTFDKYRYKNLFFKIGEDLKTIKKEN